MLAIFATKMKQSHSNFLLKLQYLFHLTALTSLAIKCLIDVVQVPSSPRAMNQATADLTTLTGSEIH